MEELAAKMSQWISNRAQDWQSLIGDDNEAIPDEDALIYQAIEELSEWLAERMVNHPAVEAALAEARLDVRESAAENVAYNRAMNGTIHDQLKWHGMSTKDFI